MNMSSIHDLTSWVDEQLKKHGRVFLALVFFSWFVLLLTLSHEVVVIFQLGVRTGDYDILDKRERHRDSA